MSAGAVPNPTPQGPPPGVSLAPPIPQPPPGVTLSAPIAQPAPAAAPPQAAAPAAPAPASIWQSLKNKTKEFIESQLDPNNDHAITTPIEAAATAASKLPVVGDAIGNIGSKIAAVRRGVIKGGLGTVAGLTHIGAQLVSDFGIDGDVADYQQKNPGASLLQARQAVAPEIYGKAALPAGQTTPNPDYQTDSHRQRVQRMMDTAKWFTDHAETNGFWEGMGSTGESIAELLGGEGLAKLLPEAAAAGDAGKVTSLADHLRNTQKVAQFLEQNPKVAKLMALGMRTAHAVTEAGTQAAGQTFIKSGGDTGETMEAGAIGAAGGGALHLAGEAAGAGFKAVKGGLERLAKPSTTVDAVGDAARGAVEDRLGATNATREPGQPDPAAEPYQFKIGGTPTRDYTVGNISQDARKQQVGTRAVAGKGSPTGTYPYNPEDLQKYVSFDGEGNPTYARPDQYENTGRNAAGEPSYPDAAGNTADTAAPDQPEGSHKEPVYQYKPTARDPEAMPGEDRAEGGGTLLTKDPKVASSHLASLEQIIGGKDFKAMAPEQRATLQASRDDIKAQLGEYYQHQKATAGGPANFKPVDVQGAIEATGNFADAAESLHNTAAEVYEHANNVTGGQWQALDQHISKLQDKLGDEPFADGRAKLRKQIGQAQSVMSQILENPANGFDANDVTQAKKNFRAKYVLQDAHEAIKPIYAIEQQPGTITGQYRGVNGSMLGTRWDEFLKANPDAKDIIGADRVNTLRDLFRQNETLAARKRFGSAVLNVASAFAGYHFGGLSGAVEGGVGYRGIKYVLDGMLSNPKVAKNILFAIQSGARAENYGPMVAKMIIAGKKIVPVAAGAAARSQQQTVPPPEN